jgi:hypothetical protein
MVEEPILNWHAISKKTIHIKIVTPWGVPLVTKALKNSEDVDIHKFMDLHYVVVRTSKEAYEKAYRFNIIPHNNKPLESKEMKQKDKEHTKKLTLELLGEHTVQHIPVEFIFTLKSSFIDINKYLSGNEEAVLIQNKSNNSTSLLNLTNVTPHVLLFFDDELYYKGASYSINSGSGSFTIQTQFKNILLIRAPHTLKLNQIISLNL